MEAFLGRLCFIMFGVGGVAEILLLGSRNTTLFHILKLVIG